MNINQAIETALRNIREGNEVVGVSIKEIKTKFMTGSQWRVKVSYIDAASGQVASILTNVAKD